MAVVVVVVLFDVLLFDVLLIVVVVVLGLCSRRAVHESTIASWSAIS